MDINSVLIIIFKINNIKEISIYNIIELIEYLKNTYNIDYNLNFKYFTIHDEYISLNDNYNIDELFLNCKHKLIKNNNLNIIEIIKDFYMIKSKKLMKNI